MSLFFNVFCYFEMDLTIGKHNFFDLVTEIGISENVSPLWALCGTNTGCLPVYARTYEMNWLSVRGNYVRFWCYDWQYVVVAKFLCGNIYRSLVDLPSSTHWPLTARFLGPSGASRGPHVDPKNLAAFDISGWAPPCTAPQVTLNIALMCCPCRMPFHITPHTRLADGIQLSLIIIHSVLSSIVAIDSYSSTVRWRYGATLANW